MFTITERRTLQAMQDHLRTALSSIIKSKSLWKTGGFVSSWGWGQHGFPMKDVIGFLQGGWTPKPATQLWAGTVPVFFVKSPGFARRPYMSEQSWEENIWVDHLQPFWFCHAQRHYVVLDLNFRPQTMYLKQNSQWNMYLAWRESHKMWFIVFRDSIPSRFYQLGGTLQGVQVGFDLHLAKKLLLFWEDVLSSPTFVKRFCVIDTLFLNI